MHHPTDGTGITFYQPLELVQVKKTNRSKRPQLSTRQAIPDNQLVPQFLVGAETRVRHTRTDKERKANNSRSKALRVFPESDERFPLLAPRRNDSESNNADKKSRSGKAAAAHCDTKVSSSTLSPTRSTW